VRPRYLRVGPDRVDGRPVLEIELVGGELVAVVLDPAHALSVASRIVECVNGDVAKRARERRVLELELVVDDAAVVA
jgi:hypothetical protein